MFYIGSDVAKRQHEVVILDALGERHGASIRFANSRDGFNELLRHLEALQGDVLVAVEPTGHYWLSWYDVLGEHGLEVVILNPLHVEAYSKAFLRKAKTDQKDAWVIGELLRRRKASPVHPRHRTHPRCHHPGEVAPIGRFEPSKQLVACVGVEWIPRSMKADSSTPPKCISASEDPPMPDVRCGWLPTLRDSMTRI